MSCLIHPDRPTSGRFPVCRSCQITLVWAGRAEASPAPGTSAWHLLRRLSVPQLRLWGSGKTLIAHRARAIQEVAPPAGTVPAHTPDPTPTEAAPEAPAEEIIRIRYADPLDALRERLAALDAARETFLSANMKERDALHLQIEAEEARRALALLPESPADLLPPGLAKFAHTNAVAAMTRMVEAWGKMRADLEERASAGRPKAENAA